MYRRIVISTTGSTSSSVTILYHVRGARLITQSRIIRDPLDTSVASGAMQLPLVYDDSIKLGTSVTISANRPYEIEVDVSENQPMRETVEEITSLGVLITVYNANGVLVCRNVPKTPTSSDPAQTDVPGEMTSVPGEEPGEMV